MILQRTQIMYDNKDQEMKIVLDEIFQTNCPELDIGKRSGWTSYIDFINPDELANAHVMKGKDVTGRNFIVFKSEVQTSEKKIRLFTIFFQRWYDSDVVYHSAGHYETHMFLTTGGACLMQIELLRDLLVNGTVNLTVEKMEQCRIGYRDFIELEKIDSNSVDTIVLGWSD
jgi:hypothetical protein